MRANHQRTRESINARRNPAGVFITPRGQQFSNRSDHEREPLLWPASSIADQDVQISIESPLRCIECGHSLRGINITSACPECGAPIADSAGVPHMTSWGANDLHLNGARGGNTIHRWVFLAALGLLILFGVALCQAGTIAL